MTSKKETSQKDGSRRGFLRYALTAAVTALGALGIYEVTSQGTNTKTVTGSGQAGKHALWVGDTSTASTVLGPSIVSEIASGKNTGMPALVLPNKAWFHWVDTFGNYGNVGDAGIQLDAGGGFSICGQAGGTISMIDGFSGTVIAQFAKTSSIKTSNNTGVAIGNGTTLAWTDSAGDILTGPGSMGITLDKTDTLLVNTKQGHAMKINDGQEGPNIASFAKGKYYADFAGPVHASSFETSSDLRFKTGIQPLKNALEKMSQLNPVTFKWSKLYKESLRRNGGDESTHAGLIAQEVEKVIPEIVTKWEQDGVADYRAIDYVRLVPYLIESIKALKAKVEALERSHSLDT
jgi:hypothetical protein